MKLGFLFALAVILAGSANAAETISKLELRTSAPSIIQKRLKDHVWEMFEVEDLRSDKRPKHALTSLSLKTRTHATMVPGLCRYDRVFIEFEPAEKIDPDETTPSTATGLTAASYFKFVKPPSDDFNEIADHTKTTRTGCASLKAGVFDGFFKAEDEEIATDGFLIWNKLQAALREDKNVPLECSLFVTDNRPCSAIITAIPQDELTSIERCEATDFKERCIEVSTGDRVIKIFANAHVSPGPPPNEVIRAKLDGLIVMWHPRED